MPADCTWVGRSKTLWKNKNPTGRFSSIPRNALAPMAAIHSSNARSRSSCSKALAIRRTSAAGASSALATSRQADVAMATSLMIRFAAASARPKYSATETTRFRSQVPSSRLILVVKMRLRTSVGVGLRSYTGRHGWTLSPVYDLNPTPTDVRKRILTTNINLDEGTCDLNLVVSVAEYFGLADAAAKRIIKEVAMATSAWRDVASALDAPAAEVRRMASAFEHDDLERALLL